METLPTVSRSETRKFGKEIRYYLRYYFHFMLFSFFSSFTPHSALIPSLSSPTSVYLAKHPCQATSSRAMAKIYNVQEPRKHLHSKLHAGVGGLRVSYQAVE